MDTSTEGKYDIRTSNTTTAQRTMNTIVPKFASGERVYSLSALNGKFVFRPETVLGIAPTSHNAAKGQINYTLQNKPSGQIFREGFLFSQGEAMDLCSKNPALYVIKDEQ